jgi:hypothetical protein
MWYVFPQLRGLAPSATSVHFGIRGVPEADAYLAHPVLGPRLIECAEAVLSHAGVSASAMFGYPDDVKLRSSATLFARVSPAGSPFHRTSTPSSVARRTKRRSACCNRAGREVSHAADQVNRSGDQVSHAGDEVSRSGDQAIRAAAR